jgi:NAD(P)-dependent dehydrogenase (short-subunit alcohol dehydrogenase family)/acyl carrier protein
VDEVTVRTGTGFGYDGSHDGRAGYTVRPAERDDYDALLADLAGRGGVPGHLVHAWTLGLAPTDDPDAVWAHQNLGFFALLSLVQALAAEPPEDGVLLDVLTCGTQDVTGVDLDHAEHATVAGIVKVVPRELTWLTARQLDLDPADDWPTAPDTRATARLLAELRAEPGDEETLALRGGRRWYRDYEQVTVPEDLGDLPAGPGLRDHGVYLITGGLGGIGITVAEDLANRVNARLVLLSRSALPPRDEWDDRLAVHGTSDRTGRAIAAVRRMEAAGAEVLVLAADATDPAAMREVRSAALARFGRVDGIVHAAGVPGGGMAEIKERAAADAVLRPKVLGTLALRAAFGADDVDFVLLCSSMYSIAGEFGQVDYCAGNTFMDAHARSVRHGWRASVVSANWGSWLDVGMSAEVAAPAAFRALQRGDKLISLDHPLLTRRYAGEGDNPGWCAGTLSPTTHWVLADHRIAGVPVLPGTGQLEAVRRAVEEVYPAPSPEHAVELRDVVFVEPMSVPDGTSAELRVVLANGQDGIEFQTVSLSGGVRRTHAKGLAAWVDPGPARVVDVAAIRARCTTGTRQRSTAFVSVTGLITFGPHWGNVQVVHEGAQEELAELVAGDAAAAAVAAGDWGVLPSLLDEATAFGRTGGDDRYLPLGYGRITIRGPLPARLYSHLRHRDTGSPEVTARDLTLYDSAGRELVAITDFTLRHVDADALSGTLRAAPAAAPSAGETLAGGSGFGIRPVDGAEAVRRLVSTSLGAQVAVSVMSVARIIESSRAFTQETVAAELDGPGAAPAAERTAEDGYVAPRNDMEAAVARIWGDGLGIAQVGVSDNFFEIGGDSLIAVQLLAMVRAEFGVRLPMRSIFEEPTVAGVAARIEELRRTQPASTVPPAGSTAVVTTPSVIPRLQRAAVAGQEAE